MSRLEAAGGVRRAEAEIDPAAIADAHARYAAERDPSCPAGLARPPAPRAACGGTGHGREVPPRPLRLVPRRRRPPGRPWVADQLEADAAAAIDIGTNSVRLLVQRR